MSLAKEWKHTTPILRKCLEDIAGQFRLPQEIVHEDRSGEIAKLAGEVSGLQDQGLRRYAARMDGRSVETLLFALLVGGGQAAAGVGAGSGSAAGSVGSNAGNGAGSSGSVGSSAGNGAGSSGDGANAAGNGAGSVGRANANAASSVGGSANAGERERLERLLELRFSKRVVVLIWAFYTWHYKDGGMDRLAESAAAYAGGHGLDIPQAHMLNLAAESRVEAKDIAEALAKSVIEEGSHLNGFFRKYEMDRESPLALAAVKKTLAACGRRGYTLNEGWMLRMIRTGEAGPDILEHYIGSLDEHDYSLKVNLAIIETKGRPVRPEDWPDIAPRYRQKFIRWCFLKELQDYYGGNYVKLQFFTSYLPHIKNAGLMGQTEESGMLTVDFGEFVVLDTEGESDYSYLCDKGVFERLWGDQGLAMEREKVLGAREYILEDAQDELTRLSFHAVGRLYAKEMIDILLGLMPDVRASQRIITAKTSGSTSR